MHAQKLTKPKDFSNSAGLILSLGSAVLLVLSFPNFNLGFLSWMALVPMLLSITGKKPAYSFVLSLIYGSVFVIGVSYWVNEVPGLQLLHFSMIVLLYSLYYGIFGLLYSLACKKLGIGTGLVLAPFLWIMLEYVRSTFTFWALPWTLLAHSQYQYPIIIQIASIAGAYGVSFIIVLVNAALTSIFYALCIKQGQTRTDHRPLSLRYVCVLSGAAAVAMLVTLVYGSYKISMPIEGRPFSLSVIQGNIPIKTKRNREHAKEILKTYAVLTRRASEERPKLIVWPEGATPQSIIHDLSLAIQIKNIAEKTSVPLLFGSSQQRKLGQSPAKKNRKKMIYQNSAVLIEPGKRLTKPQRYDKIKLLPFGEYIPHDSRLPWYVIGVPQINSYQPGNTHTIFNLDDVKFGVTICWENIFPDLVRQFVRSGAQFIINITNEAWFGKTAAPYQFVSMSVFRAVENRVFVVRSANTGVSCFIDPYGKVFERVENKNGEDIFVRGIQGASVVPLNASTVYTRYGDWIAVLSLFVSIAFVLIVGVKSVYAKITHPR